MTIDSGGGWLTPEKKKAIVVSLYIWVPLVVISALAWKYYPPPPDPAFFYAEKSYFDFMFNETSVKLIISGLLITTPAVLLWYYLTKDKSAVAGSIISLIWSDILPLFSMSISGAGRISDNPFSEPLATLLLFLFPVIICYIYHRKSVTRFTPVGYFLSVFFALVTGFVGIFAQVFLGWVVI